MTKLAFAPSRATALKAAVLGLAAMFLAGPLASAPASAAPALAGLAPAFDVPLELTASRKSRRAPVRRVGRYHRGANGALIGAAALGVLGAVIASQAASGYDDDVPVYSPYPYGYGVVGSPYVRYRQGRDYDARRYDRRYWRGGAPSGVVTGPGPYYGPGVNVMRPRGGSGWSSGQVEPRFGGSRPQGGARGGYGGRGGYSGAPVQGGRGGYSGGPVQGGRGGGRGGYGWNPQLNLPPTAPGPETTQFGRGR